MGVSAPRFAGFLAFLLVLLSPVPLSFNMPDSGRGFGGLTGTAVGQPAESLETEIRIAVREEEAVGNWSVDQNFHSRTDWGGLWVGVDSEAHLTRSFVKFDLSHLREWSVIQSAHLVAYMSGALGLEDIPIGVHYVSNDVWSETTITWANQPQHTAEAASVIDSPASPEMFVAGNSYRWNITDLLRAEVGGDKTLSLLLKLEDELCPAPRGAVFAEDEYYHFNATYISIIFSTPEAQHLSVNGHEEGLMVEYLQDSNPTLLWSFNDSDTNDYQTDFCVELFDNPSFQDPALWSVQSLSPYSLMTDCTSTTSEPFSRSNEMRIQYKYLSPLLNVSGCVDRLLFEVDTNQTAVSFENIVVTLAQTATSGDLGPSFATNFGTAIQTEVLRASYLDVAIHDDTFELDLANSFVLSQDLNLIVELRFTNCSGGTILSKYTPGTGLGSVAYTWGSGAYEEDDAFFRYPHCFGMSVVLETVSPMSWNSSAGTTSVPFALPSNSSGTLQMMWNDSVLGASGIVDRIYFHVNNTSTDVGFANLTVTLAESTLLGELNHSDMASNLDSESAVVVLESQNAVLRNLGGVLVLDIENAFTLTDGVGLLLQMSWDGVSGIAGAYITNVGHTCWNYTNLVEWGNQNVTWSPEVAFDLIRSETSEEYSGMPLPEEEYVYWRVQVRDAWGFWSDWAVHSFRYYPIEEGPTYTNLVVDPDPVTIYEEVEIRLNVTFVLGVSDVLLELDNMNHSMSLVSPDIYSIVVVPEEAGSIPFTVFMESSLGTWSVKTGWIHVLPGTSTTSSGTPSDLVPFLIIGGVAVAGISSVAVMIRRRRAVKPEP